MIEKSTTEGEYFNSIAILVCHSVDIKIISGFICYRNFYDWYQMDGTGNGDILVEVDLLGINQIYFFSVL